MIVSRSQYEIDQCGAKKDRLEIWSVGLIIGFFTSLCCFSPVVFGAIANCHRTTMYILTGISSCPALGIGTVLAYSRYRINYLYDRDTKHIEAVAKQTNFAAL